MLLTVGVALRKPDDPAVTPTATVTGDVPSENTEKLPAAATEEHTPSAPAAEKAAALVYLDVNPSFALEVSESGRILSVSANNADAEKVLAERALSDDVSIAALLGNIMDAGYLSEEKDTLLLTVECADDALSESLKTQFSKEADAFLAEKLPGGHALLQRITENRKAAKIAQKYNISKGTAAFIVRLLGVNDDYTEKKLASLDLSSLRRLCEENGISTALNVTVSRNDAWYITNKAVQEDLSDNAITHFASCFEDRGSVGVWRIALRCSNHIALYDVDSESGEAVLTDSVACLDRKQLIDAAIAGAGYTPDEILFYDDLFDVNKSLLYVRSIVEKPDSDFWSHPEIDLNKIAFCEVWINPKPLGHYLSVKVNAVTGETVSVSNIRFAIGVPEAENIIRTDLGLSKDLFIPYSLSIVGGICTVSFDLDGSSYYYEIDVYTGEILKKTVT